MSNVASNTEESNTASNNYNDENLDFGFNLSGDKLEMEEVKSIVEKIAASSNHKELIERLNDICARYKNRLICSKQSAYETFMLGLD